MSSQALAQTSSSSSQLQRTTSSSQGAVTTPNQTRSTAIGAATPQNGAQSQGSPNIRTPQQLLQRPSPTPSTPGRWEHPSMAEILSRQHRTTFDQTNAKRVVYSGACLVVATFVPPLLSKQLPRSLTEPIPSSAMLIVYAIQLLLLANITVAVLPLLRAKDNMEDIPLTPQQRQLLDLPPMSRPATPQEQAAWVTPPRYSRNGTPTSMDSLLVNARATPLSARGSPREGFPQSSSPSTMYAAQSRIGAGSPYTGSPLGRTPEIGYSRRESLGSSRGSPLAEKDIFGTPTAKSSRASTGLNNKWLYDKGKPSPVPTGFLGTGWGTDSVFN